MKTFTGILIVLCLLLSCQKDNTQATDDTLIAINNNKLYKEMLDKKYFKVVYPNTNFGKDSCTYDRKTGVSFYPQGAASNHYWCISENQTETRYGCSFTFPRDTLISFDCKNEGSTITHRGAFKISKYKEYYVLSLQIFGYHPDGKNDTLQQIPFYNEVY